MPADSSGYPTPPNHPEDDMVKGALSRIASPLTVIRGFSQLWQRRIRRGEDLDREQLFQALATIEQSGRKIGLVLRQLEGHNHDP